MPPTEHVVPIFQAFEGDTSFLSAIKARFQDEMRLYRRAPRRRKRQRRLERHFGHVAAGATARSQLLHVLFLLLLLLLLLLLTGNGAAVGGVGHSFPKDQKRGVFDLVPLFGFFALASSILTRRGFRMLLLLLSSGS